MRYLSTVLCVLFVAGIKPCSAAEPEIDEAFVREWLNAEYRRPVTVVQSERVAIVLETHHKPMPSDAFRQLQRDAKTDALAAFRVDLEQRRRAHANPTTTTELWMVAPGNWRVEKSDSVNPAALETNASNDDYAFVWFPGKSHERVQLGDPTQTSELLSDPSVLKQSSAPAMELRSAFMELVDHARAEVCGHAFMEARGIGVSVQEVTLEGEGRWTATIEQTRSDSETPPVRSVLTGRWDREHERMFITARAFESVYADGLSPTFTPVTSYEQWVMDPILNTWIARRVVFRLSDGTVRSIREVTDIRRVSETNAHRLVQAPTRGGIARVHDDSYGKNMKESDHSGLHVGNWAEIDERVALDGSQGQDDRVWRVVGVTGFGIALGCVVLYRILVRRSL